MANNISNLFSGMAMYIPKRYGQSKIERCPFCQKQAFSTNSQGIPVCTSHKNAILNDMKCICGKPLDIKSSKWGIFFLCMSCGPVSMKKAFDVNEIKDVSENNIGKRQDSAAVPKSSFSPCYKIQTKKSAANSTGSSNSANGQAHPDKKPEPKEQKKKPEREEFIIRSDDPLYFS
jgi:hypothetical protein